MEPLRTVRQQSGAYPVWLGRGLIPNLGSLIETLPPHGDVALLIGEGVAEAWGERLEAGLGTVAKTIVFPDSESRKTLSTVDDIITSLLEAGAKRDWLAVVAGGGTAGDTAGLAASIFMRGIRYVHVPTTLLAQVDSSLGGKLAVNHSLGKNLVGVFAPPAAVIADLDTLSTLPFRELRSGLYEALKGGVLGDRALFELMEENVDEISGGGHLEEVARRAIEVKIEVVQNDEREGDRRRLLNYGHTIGHGFEAATAYVSLTHGDAVAWGMIAANALAVERKLIDDRVRDRIDRTILAYGAEQLPEIDADEVFEAIGHDKKFTGRKRVMVFPVEIGECRVFEDVSPAEIRRGIEIAIERSKESRGE